MANLRILVANEPRVYREVLAAVMQALRPQVEVSIAEPGDLDHAVARLDPHVVVSSRLSEAVQTRVLVWVMLYPEGESWAEVSIAGQRCTVADIELTCLLALIDRAERLAS
jgi:hypothetical protein